MERDQLIVAITGPQGSGKSTLAQALIAQFGGIFGTAGNKETMTSAAIVKFADPLYGMQKVIHDYLKAYCQLTPLKEGEEKDRQLLQWLGSEWAQERFGPTVWSDVWKNRVKAIELGLVITDDMRFPHELNATSEVGAVKVRLKCKENTRRARIGVNFKNSTHISETALNNVSDSCFDFVFDTQAYSAQEMAKIILGGKKNG